MIPHFRAGDRAMVEIGCVDGVPGPAHVRGRDGLYYAIPLSVLHPLPSPVIAAANERVAEEAERWAAHGSLDKRLVEAVDARRALLAATPTETLIALIREHFNARPEAMPQEIAEAIARVKEP